ncbi:hypothetical protein P154DRAFT_263587 [Amniculicola lignicola CBS 123094]|uniref:Uncharacterized protein n=1 Tax=Amniculicola lignicola CBS 123094 TaxID=1392246 RepID=A0A6A5W9T3_9PLEO|nr:hypothetical protein P154DRAFT_263587 [Amniculicola lignicola CBS 123094]
MFSVHILILLAPMTSLIIWWSIVYRTWGEPIWSSALIGGRFTQFQAKMIDIIAGVFIAPPIMAIMNTTMFRVARTVLAAERPQSQRPAPLVSLLESSVTSAGTYDLFKIWRILRAWNLRFVAMATLIILSALSTSFLLNVIAYEADDGMEPDRKFIKSGPTLRLLADYTLTSPNGTGYGRTTAFSNTGVSALFGFSQDKEGELAIDYMTLLHRMYYDQSFYPYYLYYNQSGQDTQLTMFTAVNATERSLSSAYRFTSLHNIKAYRQTISCEPVTMKSLQIRKGLRGYIDYRAEANLPSETKRTISQYSLPSRCMEKAY